MDDLDHSGFVLGTFETLDSETAKGNAKIIPRVFRREIDLLEEKQ